MQSKSGFQDNDFVTWLVGQGLAGAAPEHLLERYCERLLAAGIPLMRLHLAHRAFHPVYGGAGFEWHREKGAVGEKYPRTPSTPDQWAVSPFYFMMKHGIREYRERLAESPEPNRFPFLDKLKERGGTDYFATAMAFDAEAVDGPMDPDNPPEGLIISWTSDTENGFSERDIQTLRDTLPALGLTLKSAFYRQMVTDLVDTYLGTDAGGRVLSGEIQRGTLQTIRAVICYFDLQGFTKLAETTPGPDVVAMLNAYFGVAVGDIEAHGGSVLKFMGDGLLAIFRHGDLAEAGRSAIAAAARLRKTMASLNRARMAEGLPSTGFSLALHAGDVLYGNIGAEHRLDFTIIGPAVNETSRILGMCKSLEQDIVISAAVATSLGGNDDNLYSLGRYVLRGIPTPKELFTLHAPPVENG
ncbi:MAG: adenylate/guanylate cyclase domain-containing protein [Hyphomicrobiales bacterium]|nr:adenylate/guanylate cyclase domain-containing protein [Hyphomicrobiales bacterium]